MPDQSDMFDGLVKNALDFLQRSVDELEESPKYSVIHFCTAIELLLKARLLKEHWSLVLENPRQANLGKFQSGAFISVGMNEAMARLENVLAHKFGPEGASFDQIRKHRNKLVHFFNDAYDKPSPEAISDVVAEQCNAWFHVYKLLTERWSTQFEDYKNLLTGIDAKMRQNLQYLKVAFDALQPQIEEERAAGTRFVGCRACRYESSRVHQELDCLHWDQCLVCKRVSTFLTVVCPECKAEVEFVDEGFGECTTCGKAFEPDDLVELLGSEYDPRDPDSHDIACHYCEHYPLSVVEIEDEDPPQWLCCNCLELHDRVSTCEYCNQMYTGHIELTFLTGCVSCDGKGFDDMD